jgi:hypothetical protein
MRRITSHDRCVPLWRRHIISFGVGQSLLAARPGFRRTDKGCHNPITRSHLLIHNSAYAGRHNPAAPLRAIDVLTLLIRIKLVIIAHKAHPSRGRARSTLRSESSQEQQVRIAGGRFSKSCSGAGGELGSEVLRETVKL